MISAVGAALAIFAAIALACRAPRASRSCPEHPSGEHSFILAREASGLRLRCMDCGCKSTGWAVFPRAEEIKGTK